MLFHYLISVALCLLYFAFDFTGIVIFAVYALDTFIPGLAVIVRRLHDVNKSGWFYFISLIPLIGGIWLLILLCTEGTQGPNQYGEDPQRPYENVNEIGATEAY